MRQQDDLFGNRMTISQAVEMSLGNLRAYGDRYPVWSIAYSGGKDSSATAAFVAWAVRSGQVSAPEHLVVLYADTRQELPPLHSTAMKMLDALRRDGFDARVVLPAMDKRFYVYMFGRGVPPPSNTFRWCTPGIKVAPMMDELQAVYEQYGHKILSITGVRMGESAVRDQRIVASCSRDSGECGQGWFQVSTGEAIADTLAPLLHWRVCNVYDWLYFMNKKHGYPEVAGIADVYGEDDVRTGCVRAHMTACGLEPIIPPALSGARRPRPETHPPKLSKRQCACGCGKMARGRSKYFSDSCRARAFYQRKREAASA